MATMEDIAKKCGVSKGTVSKALNGASDISESLRKKIIRTAVDMGYTRTLSLDENKKVAVIIGTDKLLQSNHFGYQIIQSFQKEALINGYNVSIHNIQEINPKENSYDT
ncbi:MAG: LacI family DNA-binding transcriptional regulator, partial [Firmicutes bacterium]|nr:LacI family DNA-binding transcriptional regulator [Bacillota bacterium]